MKKKDAIQKGVDDLIGYQPELSYSEQQRLILQKKKDDARPALLKRIGAGILDFLFVASLAAGLFAIAYFAILPSVGYQSATSFMINTYETSGLYYPKENNIGFLPLTEKYDDDRTPEQNYDEPISNFYSTNLRAVRENQLEQYVTRKVNSGYFVINDQIFHRSGIIPPIVQEAAERLQVLGSHYYAIDAMPNFIVEVNPGV